MKQMEQLKMRQYETFELTMTGKALKQNYAAVDVTAAFCCNGQEKTVSGFYDGMDEDGNGIYKVRFLPEQEGHYTWQVTGAVSAKGEADCDRADSLHHGMVRATGTHFTLEDGSAFYPFGTTVYALANQSDELVGETIRTMKNSPFNKVRMCVFPKHYVYNHNEPLFYMFRKTDGTDALDTGFTENDGAQWDTSSPDIRFWQRFERICAELGEAGIQIDLILFHPYDRWGFSAMKTDACLTYLDYLVRRLSAFPYFWWSMANEYDLMAARTPKDWDTFGNFLKEHDPYGHLLSNHNCFRLFDFSRDYVTHACIQSSWTYRAAQYIAGYHKPVIYDEMRYEGNLEESWGSISGFEMVNRFWTVCAQGAYGTHGETFLPEDEIVWWARGGRLIGESPRRIAFLKDFIYSLPGALTPVTGMWNRMMEIRKKGQAAVDAALAAMPAEVRTFAGNILNMDETEQTLFLLNESVAAGKVGDLCQLYYYGRMCPGRVNIRVKKGSKYKVERIDAWEMTRETVFEEITPSAFPAGGFTAPGEDTAEQGNICVSMPSREGMAVLVSKI